MDQGVFQFLTYPLISEKKGGKPLKLENGSRRRSVLDEDHGDHGQEEEEEEGRQGGQGGPRVSKQ